MNWVDEWLEAAQEYTRTEESGQKGSHFVEESKTSSFILSDIDLTSCSHT